MEIIGRRDKNSLVPEDAVPCVNVKPENLKTLEEKAFLTQGCPLFEQYVLAKYCIMSMGKQTGPQTLYDVLAELFEQPWYKGTHQLKLVMSSLARETGRTSQALDLLMECLADVPAKDKETQSRLHCEVALELMEGADFDGAMDSLQEIEQETDYMAICRN